MLNTIVGNSHIYFLKEGTWGNWSQDPEWDWNSIIGSTSCPIYHENFINAVQERYTSGKYNTIFAFVLKSVLFNSLVDWMQNGLDQGDCKLRMNHDVYLKSLDNPKKWYILEELLKHEPTIDIQNKFYKMWLDWYVVNFPNVKFVFWCEFSDEYTSKRNWLPHLCYDELYERYKTNCVDLYTFANKYDISKVHRDTGFHPSEYGYESLRNYLKECTF